MYSLSGLSSTNCTSEANATSSNSFLDSSLPFALKASCVTVSHSESGGYGYACGTPEYYEQYNGKDSETYTEVPNIVADAVENPGITGGATQTSTGYKNAIKAAFTAFATLTTTAEGGTN